MYIINNVYKLEIKWLKIIFKKYLFFIVFNGNINDVFNINIKIYVLLIYKRMFISIFLFYFFVKLGYVYFKK